MKRFASARVELGFLLKAHILSCNSVAVHLYSVALLGCLECVFLS